MKQKHAFMSGEGDAWHKRNLHAPMNPIVTDALTHIDCTPSIILEMGCGYGRYLNEMHKCYRCKCIGYDPSASAIDYGRKNYPHLDLRVGATDDFFGLSVDILVFGFCLYLADRDELFDIVSTTDVSLCSGSYLVIHDFDPAHPHILPYHHADGLWSYKMNYPALWLAHPEYQLVSKTTTAEGEAITIMRKGPWKYGVVT